MDEARTVEEAREYFLTHASGDIVCIDGERRFRAECYPDAVDFFRRSDTGEQ